MNKVVYHGSPKGNIKELRANMSSHQKKCIYATNNKCVAFMFMGRGNGDLDTVKLFNDGQPIIIERRPGVFNKLYNKPGYLYELDGSSFEHYSFLWEPEVISFEESIIPTKVTYFDNILDAMYKEQENGTLTVYTYPSRPVNIPLDNSDLIDKYIWFYEQGFEDAIDNLLDIYPEFSDIIKEKLEMKKK